MTRIPFFSFGNIIAIKATGFEIRTLSKSEQRTAVGCGRLREAAAHLWFLPKTPTAFSSPVLTPFLLFLF